MKKKKMFAECNLKTAYYDHIICGCIDKTSEMHGFRPSHRVGR